MSSVIDKDGKPIFIDLGSDDDEADHPRDSDDDDDDHDGPPKVKEMKPLVLPSGGIVKVERGYWKEEEDKRNQRIARMAKREAKDKELTEANAKLLQVQLESQAQISTLSSQFEELRGMLKFQLSQQSTFAPSQLSMPPPVPVIRPPSSQEVQHLPPGLWHPRVEDEGHVTSLVEEDVVVCTALSQMAPSSSSELGTPVRNAPQPGDARDYRRLDDILEKDGGQTSALGVEHDSNVACQAVLEVPESSPVNKEEMVDYGDSDPEGNVPEEKDGSAAATEHVEVKDPDPYDFD